MDPTRNVRATERTWDAGRTDGRTDGHTDWRTDGVKPIYPQQLCCVWGIIMYLKILLLLPGTNGLNTSRLTTPMASLPQHRSIVDVTMAIIAKVHVICHSAIHQFTLTDLCRQLHEMLIELNDKVSKQQIIFYNNLRCIKWTTLRIEESVSKMSEYTWIDGWTITLIGGISRNKVVFCLLLSYLYDGMLGIVFKQCVNELKLFSITISGQ